MNNTRLSAKNLIVKSSLILDPTQLTPVEQALFLAQENLQTFTSEPDFGQKMAIAFGEGANVDSLKTAWSTGDFSIFPEIEIRYAADINGANGAFAAATNKIYLSQEFIINHQGDVGAIARVILEEFGHWVDTQINTTDAPGDEGDIFAAFVRGETLNKSHLQSLKAEDDTATVILDGKIVVVEQAASTYKFDIVAKTGGGFQSLGDNPSINDRGLVAFVGTTLSDVDIYTGNPDGSLTDVTGALRSAPNTTRAVQINNQNQIVTHEFRLNAAFNAITAIRVWDANRPGNFRNVAANVSNNFQLLSQPSINNNVTAGVDNSFINNVVFSARLGTSGLLRTPQELPNPAVVNSGVYNEEVLPTPVRPMISDDDIVGGVVVRFGNTASSPIFLYKNDLSSFQTIANVSMGFTNLGQSPGISDDGQVVTFYGDLSAAGAIALDLKPGAGIFASVNTTNGRIIQRIAGVSGNGFLDPGETFTDTNENGNLDAGEDIGLFASFGKDSRVGTNYNLFFTDKNENKKLDSDEEGKGLGTITYLALDQAGNEGLYTSALSTSVSEAAGGISLNPGIPTLVAKVGDTIPGMDGTIQNLEIYDPINQAGQISFWASFSDGKSAIIRANPPAPKVVNIVTHGFGNRLPLIFPTFLDSSFTLGKKLESLAFGTPLEGQVKSYVSNWDSSTGWAKGLSSVAVSTIFEVRGVADVVKLAKNIAIQHFNRAGRLAENAARTIVNDVIGSGLLNDPQLSLTEDQMIHLVGHSRGAAVNARVATLLAAKGYKINQYTALDGYSTDWPGLAGIFGDIKITDEVNTIQKLGKLEKAVNYRVENDLFTIDQIFSSIKSTLVFEFLAQNLQIIRDAFIDAKAPIRPGFENTTLKAPTDSSPTNHLNITEYYINSDGRSVPDEQYILKNYVGQQRPSPSKRILRSLSNDSFSRLSSDAVSAFAEPAISASNNNYGNFADGTFEELGSLQQQIASTIFTDIDDPAVQNWITQIQNPAELVSFIWDVTGNVQLVREENNTLIELNQTNDTSLGQLLNLNNNPNVLEFDLSVLSAGVDDKIQAVFNGNVLGEFVLTSLPANGRYSVSLSGLGFQSGELTFRLVGPTDTPSVVRLDNLSILDVVSANRNPVANDDKTFNVLEDNASTSLNITVPTDPDGDVLTVTVNTVPDASKGEIRLSNGTILTTGSTLTTEQLTGLLFAPVANASGNAGTFSYNVSDGQGGIDSQTITLEITPVNDAPVVQTAIADQNASEDSLFNFPVPANAFSDIDADDTLTYTATLDNGNILPSWLIFNAATRSFSGTPENSNVGNFDVKVTATDSSGATISDTFALTVANVNDAPTLNKAIANQTTLEDEIFNFTFDANTFSDVDAGDILSYKATLANGNPLPTWLNFNATTRTFSGRPTNSDVGTLSLKLTATDIAGASSEDIFDLQIINVNDAPIATNDTATTNQNTPLTLPVTNLLANDSDIDGNSLSITAVSNATNGSVVFNTQQGNVVFTPVLDFNGTASFNYAVTDGNGGTSTATVAVTVNPSSQPNKITGTSGRDTLTGTSKSDRIIGLQGADTLTGGGGNDQFVYTNIRDRGDTITDFEVGKDNIVFTELLDSLVTGSYNGTNAIADGYVKVVQGTSASNFSVQIDADGPTGNDIFRPFITVNLAGTGTFNNPSNFVF